MEQGTSGKSSLRLNWPETLNPSNKILTYTSGEWHEPRQALSQESFRVGYYSYSTFISD